MRCAPAMVLAPKFEQVRLWVFEEDLARKIQETRENDVFLPGFQLSPQVEATSELRDALEDAEIVLGVMPSKLSRP